MVVDAKERFAERAAKMLADLSLNLQAQGVEDPYEQLAERTASYTPDYESLVYSKLSTIQGLSSQSSR